MSDSTATMRLVIERRLSACWAASDESAPAALLLDFSELAYLPRGEEGRARGRGGSGGRRLVGEG